MPHKFKCYYSNKYFKIEFKFYSIYVGARVQDHILGFGLNPRIQIGPRRNK